VVGFIRKLAGLIIAAFLIGGGLYIAGILYSDGMGELNSPAPDITIGQTLGTGGSWIDGLFTHVTSPGAVLALSLGIGGLSIVALYVAHELLSLIREYLAGVYRSAAALYSALKYRRAIRQCEARLRALASEDQTLVFHDADHWRASLTDEALSVISDRLMVHEQALQEWEYHSPRHRWEEDTSADARRVAASVKKIRAITGDDILAALNPPKTLRT